MSPAHTIKETRHTTNVKNFFFNESQTLENLVNRVIDNPFSKEIVLVDDGSTDDSLAIAQRLVAQHSTCADGFSNRLLVKEHEKNIGKGAALKTGLLSISGELVVLQDADLEYHPEEILQLIQPILDGNSDVVYGSRFIHKASSKSRKHSSGYRSNYIANQVITRFSNLLTGLNHYDWPVVGVAHHAEGQIVLWKGLRILT
mgnify:CR=1 FL=1